MDLDRLIATMNLSFSQDDKQPFKKQPEHVITSWEDHTIALARKELLNDLDSLYIISKRKRKLYELNKIEKITKALIVNELMDFEKKYCYSKKKKKAGPCLFSINNSDYMILVSPISKKMLEQDCWLVST